MTSRKLASAAAAASLAGVAVLGMSGTAVAQSSSDPCYPPPCTASISDSTLTPGQTATANSGSGSFNPGDEVTVRVLGMTSTVIADSSGNASLTFTVPNDARPGRYAVVFSRLTNTVEVPFTVVAAAAAGPGQGQGSGLPRTGSDELIPLTVGGLALVGIGAGIVVAARRRREDLPAGLA